MGDQVVKLHGITYSPFSVRVEIALKMKGIEYEFISEDIQNKSEDLLKYNPIHKKVPVLLHGGKPLVESLVILEYIDETWKFDGIADLLPTDPYDRAQARFWAKFMDDKLLSVWRNAIIMGSEGEVGKKATEEAHELLKFLENEITRKQFFGGNEIGFLDISGLVTYWLLIIQEVVGKEVFTRDKYPAISAWIDRLLDVDVIKESMPSREELLTVMRARLPVIRANVPK